MPDRPLISFPPLSFLLLIYKSVRVCCRPFVMSESLSGRWGGGLQNRTSGVNLNKKNPVRCKSHKNGGAWSSNYIVLLWEGWNAKAILFLWLRFARKLYFLCRWFLSALYTTFDAIFPLLRASSYSIRDVFYVFHSHFSMWQEFKLNPSLGT